jgi:hypothetical protein
MTGFTVDPATLALQTTGLVPAGGPTPPARRPDAGSTPAVRWRRLAADGR